jgi:hypothetical protein
VKIDDRAVVETDASRERIQADLETAVEVPAVWRFEIEDEIYAEG